MALAHLSNIQPRLSGMSSIFGGLSPARRANSADTRWNTVIAGWPWQLFSYWLSCKTAQLPGEGVCTPSCGHRRQKNSIRSGGDQAGICHVHGRIISLRRFHEPRRIPHLNSSASDLDDAGIGQASERNRNTRTPHAERG